MLVQLISLASFCTGFIPRSVPGPVLALGRCMPWSVQSGGESSVCGVSWTMSQIPPAHLGQEPAYGECQSLRCFSWPHFPACSPGRRRGFPRSLSVKARWLSLQHRQRAQLRGGRDSVWTWEGPHNHLGAGRVKGQRETFQGRRETEGPSEPRQES